MGEPMLVVAIRRVVDDDGSVSHVEVRGSVAAILKAAEPRLKEVPFADVGLDPSGVVTVPSLPRRKSGNPWEGPKFRFAWLIGESRVWRGDPRGESGCQLCHGWPLPRTAYCLGCDRCGRDGEIPTAGPQQRPRKPRGGKLKGGRR